MDSSAPIEAKTIQCSELVTEYYPVSHATYDYNYIIPQTGGQSTNIISTGGLMTTFEIPPGAINFGETIYNFSMVPTAIANNFF